MISERDGESGERDTPSDRPRDDDFDTALAGYLDRLNAGEMLVDDEIREAHPGRAEELISTLESFREIATAATAPNLGTLGDYAITAELGHGGMGVVYEAVDTNLDRRVALKVLPAGLKIHEKAVVRFRREARVVGKLRHPNIVSVYATGVEDRTPYIAMEFVEGETLEEILDRKRPREEVETGGLGSALFTAVTWAFVPGPRGSGQRTSGDPAARSRDEIGARDTDSRSPIPASTEDMDLTYCIRMARTFAEVADGLQHAHSQGVLHRDLKPSNLILDAGGNLRILDFGLAHLEGQESLTGSGEIVGTPRYMSPEQARARRVAVDHRTDIYSLGATLYEVVTLRPPFRGRDTRDTLNQIMERDPRPPGQVNSLVPRDLETIILKCLRKNPSDRYGTAEALAQDLRRFARGAPIEARPQSAGEKLARLTWRHRGKVAATGAILVLLSVLGWLLLDRARAAREIRLARYEPQVKGAIMQLEFGSLFDLGSGRFVWGSEGWNLEPLLRGLDFGELEGVEDAIATLRAATEAVPWRPDAYYHLGRALLLSGDEREAERTLQPAVDRGFVPAMVLRASLLERRGDTDAARRLMDRVRRSGQEAWSEAWLAAHRAILEKDWLRAVNACDRLVERLKAAGEPYLGASIEVYLGRGLARFELRDYDGAREDFKAASVLWPEATEPELFLAFARYAQGEEEEAAQIFEALHRRSPQSEVASYVCIFYAYTGQMDRAIEWARRTDSENLRDLWVGTWLRNTGQFDEAIQPLERLVARGPPCAFPYLSLAQAVIEAGDPGRGAELAREAIALAPDNALPRVLLGAALEAAGDREQGLEVTREAARLEPDLPAVHIRLGQFLSTMGRLAEAAAEYEKGLEIQRRRGRGSAFFHDGLREALLAEIYGELRRDRDSLDMLCQAVRINLENPVGIARLYVHDILANVLAHDAGTLGRQDLDRLADLLDRKIERAAKRDVPVRLLTDNRASLILAILHGSGSPDRIPLALSTARELLDLTGGLDARSLELLARAQFRSGQPGEATRTLERALRLPAHGLDTSPFLEPELREYVERRKTDLLSYAAIDEVLAELNHEVLVPVGATWRFFRGSRAPAIGDRWAAPTHDDSEWQEGPSGFGYGDGDDATVLEDMAHGFTTLYVRHVFSVPDASRWARLVLSVRADDGFVAYLNGEELARHGVRWDRVLPHDATAYQRAVEPLIPIEIEIPLARLRVGQNVLALQGFNYSADSSDFSLIPELRAELAEGRELTASLLDRLRSSSDGDNLEGRLAFTQGRLLEQEGRHEEALDFFTLAEGNDPASVAAHMARAACLRALGRPEEAGATLRAALEILCPGADEIWSLWLLVSLVDLGGDATALLADFPCRTFFAKVEAGGHSSGNDGGANAYWLLTRLRDDGVVRINCGGTRYVDSGGHLWGRDRFWVTGRQASYAREIESTDRDPLFQSERYFPNESTGVAGYVVPLPQGRYRVTLHFSEIFYRITDPGQRVFDVFLEGKKVLEAYDALARVGHSSPDRQEFVVSVEDGHLDIGFGHRVELPKISAFEIELVTSGSSGIREDAAR